MKPYIFLLLLIVICLLFFNLGVRPLLSSGEARAAEIAVEMLSRGNILIPYLNEEMLLTKPVLFHWFIILSYKFFGVGEFAARLPSAIAGILVIILVCLLGKQFWGVKAGFISGLILVTSPLFFWSARCARIDAVLLFFILLSLYCFWQGYKKLPQGKTWFLGWFFFMGLGFFTKGPVGAAVPLVTVLLFLLFTQPLRAGAGRNALKELNWMWGILVFLAVSLPWYILIYFLVPHYKSEYFFLQQNLVWFSGKGEWYKCLAYIPHLFAGFFPWSLFLPLALVYTWRDFKSRRDERIAFLWIWFLVVFIIFSFSGKKVSRYILPLYPAISLLVAGTWIKGNFRRIVSVVMGSLVAIWGVLLLGINLFSSTVKLWPEVVDPLLVSIVKKHLSFSRLEINVVSVLLIILGIIGMLKMTRRYSLTILVTIMAVSLIMFITHWIPIEEEYYSPKPFCEMMKRVVPPDASICAYKSWDNTIRFYFGRHVECVPYLYDSSRDEYAEQDLLDFIDSADEVYCLMWEKVYINLSSSLKQRFEVAVSGYRLQDYKVVLLRKI